MIKPIGKGRRERMMIALGSSRQPRRGFFRGALRLASGAVVGMALPALLQPGVAIAAEEWCDTDPIVPVVVNGKPLLLHLNIQVPLSQMKNLDEAATAKTISWKVDEHAGKDGLYRVRVRAEAVSRNAKEFPVRMCLTLLSQGRTGEVVAGTTDERIVTTIRVVA